MSARIRVFVQYLIVLLITVFLVWFSLQAIQVEEGQNRLDFILDTWYASNKSWMLTMFVLFMISHLIRAQRWRMLLASTGHPTSLYKSFLSVMIAYLVNLVIPRGGEVSRCYNLYRLEGTPVEVSFGTVVVERIIDLLFLILIVVLAFAVESDKLVGFIRSLPVQPLISMDKTFYLVGIAGVAIGVAGLGYWIIRRNTKLREKVKKIWTGFKSGLGSIRKLENKNIFIIHSVGIWMLYFLMSYSVIQAFDEISHLGFGAVLSIFAIGTIAMAAPLPGGTGSYHVMIPAGLIALYQLPKANAVAFTFVFHGWQTLILIVTGVIALILTSLLLRKKA